MWVAQLGGDVEPELVAVLNGSISQSYAIHSCIKYGEAPQYPLCVLTLNPDSAKQLADGLHCVAN